MQYLIYRTNGQITNFHEAKETYSGQPVADLIYDYNVKNVEKNLMAELVEVESGSFADYLIQRLQYQESEWTSEIDNMIDSLSDVKHFLERIKYE